MTRCHWVTLLTACLLGLSPAISFTVSLAASPQKAYIKKQAPAGQKIPAGMVRQAEAVQRVQKLMDNLQKAIAPMGEAYYAENATATLRRKFAQHHVNADGDRYASPWGGNGLYLTWDSVRSYYDRHYQALSDSMKAIQAQKFVKKSDIDYLEQGMEAWQGYEKRFPLWFDKQSELMAERARALGLSIEASRKKFATKDSAMFQALSAQVEAYDQEAESYLQASVSLGDQIRKAASKHIFSALNAPEPEIIRRID